MKTRALFALLAALLLATAGCGQDDTSRPTVTELEKAMAEGDPTGATTPGYRTCLAEGLEKSDLPDGVLRKMAQDKSPDAEGEDAARYAQVLADLVLACRTEGAATPGGS